ncbi:sensor histidine kinase NtrY-like [Oceanicella actignis]|uniref:sensor histidine kinase NtrY-like n=1 Tax=Oceanicella actignis TaxID=1189325 RepID=UPI0011E643E9|nr:PAS domain-containing sensor histidine kinase [Oceanicella actignis]TYO89905.1 two-component system nitrogen regulation sensor histidine kinase NtrY [Oceanicella actignis]
MAWTHRAPPAGAPQAEVERIERSGHNIAQTDGPAAPPAPAGAPEARAPNPFARAGAARPLGAKLRGLRGWAAAALVALGPLLAVLTVATATREGQELASPELVRGVYLLDLVYVIVVAALVVWRIATLISARRARSAGSRLHLRLTAVFTLVALAPTVLVAVFATLTVSYGLEGWFSDQIRSVVRNSLATAQAYEREHRGRIRGDAVAIAAELGRAGALGAGDAQLGEVLRAQARLREVPQAYVFDSAMDLRARGEFSYLFWFRPPTPEQMARARAGEVVILEDKEAGEIGALVWLRDLFDYYLLVARPVNGNILSLLDETRETVRLYETLEASRDGVLLEFAALYLGFALLVILAAVWLGLWFAEKLARPIGRLAGAAQRVGAGDLGVRVPVDQGDDEVAVLSRVFNRMIEQVAAQRDALMAANREAERRRRFIEAVLAGVTAGVVRLDAEGRIELMNDAAARLLGVDAAQAAGRPLAEVAPLFAELVETARARRAGEAEARVHGHVGGRERDFLARVARTGAAEGAGGEPTGDAADAAGQEGAGQGGLVLTFDDLTELVSAQRMAAWGDVARRIAHEIKNPLTPIQLSAERLKRKFGAGLSGEARARFDQYADMIVRQAGDIRRMVDEFNRFARMPAPEPAPNDLRQILDEAALLRGEAAAGVAFEVETEGAPRPVPCDRGLMGQALANLLKNAAEAVEARLARAPEPPGLVRARILYAPDRVEIRIIDNGAGLPAENRARLMEPYVTTREKGAGLGLAIVKKIVEEHGGTFALTDSPDGPGAMALIVLPAAQAGPPPGATQEETENG